MPYPRHQSARSIASYCVTSKDTILNDNVVSQPKNWVAPNGYANGVAAESLQVFIAGEIGWNAQAKLVGDDLNTQIEPALSNIIQALAEAGAPPRLLVRMTWYPTNKSEYCAR